MQTLVADPLVRALLNQGAMKRASTLLLVLLAACGSEQSSSSSALTREPGECSDVEVHVIGVSDGGDGGSPTVILARPGRHMLVLSAYEATDWNIEVKPGATLERVYAVGHFPQRVHANVATKIQSESAMEGGPDVNGYAYPDKSTTALLKLTALRVDRHATSFHGCFSASRWTIGENMAVTSDCATGEYHQYDAVTDCDGDNECDGSGGGGGGGSGSGSGSGGGGGDGSLY